MIFKYLAWISCLAGSLSGSLTVHSTIVITLNIFFYFFILLLFFTIKGKCKKGFLIILWVFKIGAWLQVIGNDRHDNYALLQLWCKLLVDLLTIVLSLKLEIFSLVSLILFFYGHNNLINILKSLLNTWYVIILLNRIHLFQIVFIVILWLGPLYLLTSSLNTDCWKYVLFHIY